MPFLSVRQTRFKSSLIDGVHDLELVDLALVSGLLLFAGQLLVELGANVLVMGTGFFKSEHPEELMALIERLENK